MKIEPKIKAPEIARSPFAMVKRILRMSQSLGSISFTYHIAPAVHSPATDIPRLLFSNAWPNRHASENVGLRKQIENLHDVIISHGAPTNYLSLMASQKVINQRFSERIQKRVASHGIVDEYIIPVYGPYKIEGCMCFGFKQDIHSLEPGITCQLESLASVSHIKIVACFGDKMEQIDLSRRETEVLQWLAFGKSVTDISTILGVQPTTIDSYTRRIYAKFGVHNKISAVLAGVSTGKVSL
ncbi:MAG: LuxR C-terminal-related transcriptional regulator [Parasphingorhabdus sp.]|uniref:helix-turn-helix transcriptional regulator n=1 Tax=Parasphingorhabdus sp. TaxID=2709688 RepID=UPI00329765CC